MTLAELGMPSIPLLLSVPRVEEAFTSAGEPTNLGFEKWSEPFFHEFERYPFREMLNSPSPGRLAPRLAPPRHCHQPTTQLVTADLVENHCVQLRESLPQHPSHREQGDDNHL
jgi:hypothetical protein